MADNSKWGLGDGDTQGSRSQDPDVRAVTAAAPETQREYWFSLRLRVDSPTQLWQAAALRCLSQADLSQEEVEDLIGPIEDPSIADCLMLLALPERLPGCTRLDTALLPADAPGAAAWTHREPSDALSRK